MEVKENTTTSRYELIDGDEVIGFADFTDEGDVRTFPSFQVLPAHQGGGNAGKLAAFAVQDVRSKGIKAKAVCPYFQTYLKRHPEDQDILIDDQLEGGACKF